MVMFLQRKWNQVFVDDKSDIAPKRWLTELTRSKLNDEGTPRPLKSERKGFRVVMVGRSRGAKLDVSFSAHS